MSVSTQTLNDFRIRHRLRFPDPSRIHDQQETVRLEASDGLHLLTPAPVTDVRYGKPGASRTEHANTYLWVIDTRGIPYVFEAPIAKIGSVYPKHTNLTGGAEAYLGGEMWFASTVDLYLSGGSGRYHPEDRNQLEEAAQVFESFGYQVTSLGWNDSLGEAKRILEVT